MMLARTWGLFSVLTLAGQPPLALDDVVFWDRPGLPAVEESLRPAEGERIDALRVDVGLNEMETLGFYCTAGRDLGEATVTVEGPGELVDFATLARREPLNKLRPVDGPVTLAAGTTLHLWWTFDTLAADPGEYPVKFVVTAGEEKFTLPVTVTVWDVALPEENRVHSLTYSGSLGFLNSVTKADDEALLERFDLLFTDLRLHRVDVLDIFVNPAQFPSLIQLRDTGQRLPDAPPERFRTDPQGPVKIIVYRGETVDCHKPMEQFMREVATKHPDRLKVEFVNTDTPDGALACRQAVGCPMAGIVVNGRNRFQVEREGQPATVQFYGAMDRSPYYTQADVQAVLDQALAGKLTTFPALDFSDLDAYVDLAVRRGFQQACLHFGQGTETGSLFNRLAGREMDPATEEFGRYFVWFWGEFCAYLKGRGLTTVWGKISDEFGADYVDTYLRLAEWVRAAGYRPFSTWTGLIPRQVDALRRLNPRVDQWQVQMCSLEYFRQSRAAAPEVVDGTDEVWFYGGGSQPWRQAYEDTRAMGWLSGYYGLDGVGYWVYWWWSENEQSVFLEDDTLLTTPAWEGFRDGLEDAQFYALLNEKRGGQDHRHGLVAPEGEGILHLVPRRLDYTTIAYDYLGFENATPANLRAAKRELLRQLKEIGRLGN